MKMRREGFFRLWLVASCCWISAVSLAAIPKLPGKPITITASKFGGVPVTDYDGLAEKAREAGWVVVNEPGAKAFASPSRVRYVARNAELGFIPPIALYFFGFQVLPWIGRGFAGPK